jgi:hypothetical protein
MQLPDLMQPLKLPIDIAGLFQSIGFDEGVKQELINLPDILALFLCINMGIDEEVIN